MQESSRGIQKKEKIMNFGCEIVMRRDTEERDGREQDVISFFTTDGSLILKVEFPFWDKHLPASIKGQLLDLMRQFYG